MSLLPYDCDPPFKALAVQVEEYSAVAMAGARIAQTLLSRDCIPGGAIVSASGSKPELARCAAYSRQRFPNSLDFVPKSLVATSTYRAAIWPGPVRSGCRERSFSGCVFGAASRWADNGENHCVQRDRERRVRGLRMSGTYFGIALFRGFVLVLRRSPASLPPLRNSAGRGQPWASLRHLVARPLQVYAP